MPWLVTAVRSTDPGWSGRCDLCERQTEIVAFVHRLATEPGQPEEDLEVCQLCAEEAQSQLLSGQ